MNERIHAYLDGEISLDDLDAAERALALEMQRAIAGVTEPLQRTSTPDLVGRVMQSIPAPRPLPVHTAKPPVWRQAVVWLWKPRPVRLSFRPAYAFAGAVAAFLVVTEMPTSGAPESRDVPAAVAPAAAPPVYVQFRLEAQSASEVALAGTFTGWQPAYRLRESRPGEWSVLVPLQPGVHDYAFIVDGHRWVVDPHAPQVDDSFGGTNSRISLPPLGNAS